MFLFGNWFICVPAVWRRLVRRPLRLIFRTFEDPDVPRPWSEDAISRGRVGEAWIQRLRSRR